MANRRGTMSVRLACVLLAVCAVVACGRDDEPTGPGGGGGGGGDPTDAWIFDDRDVADFTGVSAAEREAVRADVRVYYGHTSHGSQLVTGLEMLAAEDASYALPQIHEVGSDLGHGGDVSWAATTRAYLEGHPGTIDVVMWSWCGGVSDNTAEGIDAYLAAMAALEADYPDLVFVYMTGHLDGGGTAGNLQVRNEQIRSWCRAHGKVLFDFAAIETVDPDGGAHADDTDACNWCAQWCATHDCPDCGGCAHSHCFNCYRKGMALWVLLASVAGR